MPETNLELVRRVYASPDFFAVEGATAPDIEFDFSEIYPDRPVLRGVAEMKRFRDETWSGPVRFEPEDFIELDDERVLVVVRATATGKTSGIDVGSRAAHEITIRDGQAVRVKVYPDPGRALDG